MSVGAYFHDKTLFFEFVQGKTDSRLENGLFQSLPCLAAHRALNLCATVGAGLGWQHHLMPSHQWDTNL